MTCILPYQDESSDKTLYVHILFLYTGNCVKSLTSMISLYTL